MLEGREFIRQRHRQYGEPIVRALRSIALPGLLVVLGAQIEQEIQTHYQAHNFYDLRTWRGSWQIAPILVAYAALWVWDRSVKYDLRRADRIYQALLWFYRDVGWDVGWDVGFDTRDGHQVRCTIWIPPKHVGHGPPSRLMQLVDYVPLVTNAGTCTRYRIHKTAGRSFPIVRKRDGVAAPKGALGVCVFEAVQKRMTLTYRPASPPGGVDFIKYLVSEFNFTEREAKKLDPDRRSWLCGAMMDASGRTLLGVVYCDALGTEAFSKQDADKLKACLPLFADMLVAPN